MSDFTTYQSPFSWRYGSEAMRHIWSEENKYQTWRRIWVELARAQCSLGLVSAEELADLEKHQSDINIARILEIEKEKHHDVVSAITEFAERAKVGAGKIHAGATSMDVVDNTDTLRIQESLEVVEKNLIEILKSFTEKIEHYAETPGMAYTHLQPAEPTTLGYRFSMYAQDLLEDLTFLRFVKKHLKAKGLKGAVGTQASYAELIGKEHVSAMEEAVMKQLGVEPVLIANQVGLRKADFFVAQLLVSIAGSLYKFAFDVRVMQSAGFGEWQEPFGKSQVGSSAMPFKKNPWKSEQLCSLARLIESLSKNAWENGSLSLLERTLDDSANRRIYIPEMFLALDEMLLSANKIITGLVINEEQIKQNLEKFGPFAASEGILMESVKKGASRQEMHETLREIAMVAWNDVKAGKQNPMKQLLIENKEIKKYISAEKLETLLDVTCHIGTAPERARLLVQNAKKVIADEK